MNRDKYLQTAVAVVSILMLLFTLLMDWVRLNVILSAQPISGWTVLNSLGSLSSLATDQGTELGLQLMGINNTLYLILVPLLGSILTAIVGGVCGTQSEYDASE